MVVGEEGQPMPKAALFGKEGQAQRESERARELGREIGLPFDADLMQASHFIGAALPLLQVDECALVSGC